MTLIHMIICSIVWFCNALFNVSSYVLSNVHAVESFTLEGPRMFVVCFMVLFHYLPGVIDKNHERISQAS